MSDPPASLLGGRYQLRDELGRGGMATVYRAWDDRLEVERAVKLLKPELAAHKLARERFANEARAMARIHHPNVLTVHDVVLDQEHSFLVMEIAQGGSLDSHIQEHGPMTPDAAVDLVCALLDGLAEAHAQGIVHRDIKPQNILLTPTGAKLSDFGIAQLNDAMFTLTASGMALGTLSYMAPEQQVDARSVDRRADVYAMGGTLYHLLTGKSPAHLYSVDAGDARLAGLETELADVIRKATSFHPEQRYASAEEMVAALRGTELPVGRSRLPVMLGLLSLGAIGGSVLLAAMTGLVVVVGGLAPWDWAESWVSVEQAEPVPLAPVSVPVPEPTQPPKPVPDLAPKPVVVPTARPVPPAPAPVARAKLSVNTLPQQLEVRVDGRAVGRSPLIALELPVGAHKLEVVAPDGSVQQLPEVALAEDRMVCWNAALRAPFTAGCGG
jgi:tRNA A-37 threonylcarbamoyl transferase component Bud32